MITLGEWQLVVDVPDDLGESEADALSAAVLISLAEWSVGAEGGSRPVRGRFEFTSRCEARTRASGGVEA